MQQRWMEHKRSDAAAADGGGVEVGDVLRRVRTLRWKHEAGGRASELASQLKVEASRGSVQATTRFGL